MNKIARSLRCQNLFRLMKNQSHKVWAPLNMVEIILDIANHLLAWRVLETLLAFKQQRNFQRHIFSIIRTKNRDVAHVFGPPWLGPIDSFRRWKHNGDIWQRFHVWVTTCSVNRSYDLSFQLQHHSQCRKQADLWAAWLAILPYLRVMRDNKMFAVTS